MRQVSFKYRSKTYDLSGLVAALPADAFGSAQRSTLPLLDYWRQPSGRIEELERFTGIKLAEPIELHFEYAVPPPRGRGKSSFTDLMVIASNAAIAIEAKYTEPVYPQVADWLGDGSPNRKEVLQGWLDLINAAANASLADIHVASLPYQLIHRTASVCSIDQSLRAVVYQTFGQEPVNQYAAAIKELRERGVSSIDFVDWNVVAKPMEELVRIEQSFKKGTPELQQALRQAISKAPLFDFSRQR